jgi:hypothetical protein
MAIPERRMTARVLTLAVCAAAFAVTSCGDDCSGIASCVAQPAMRVTVTNALAGGPVPNVAVVATGAPVYSTQCSSDASATICTVLGDPGVFTLTVSAPGFQSAQRTVTVRGTTGQCECVVVMVEQLAVALVPTP